MVSVEDLKRKLEERASEGQAVRHGARPIAWCNSTAPYLLIFLSNCEAGPGGRWGIKPAEESPGPACEGDCSA